MPGRHLIPIEGSPSTALKAGGKSDPYELWMRYYRTRDENKIAPGRLRETVRLLNQSGKIREVHAALRGYLTNHGSRAEPWMYEALAIAIAMNQGSLADIKTSFNYAADLAQRSHNPNYLVSVADKMMMQSYFDRVGPLLDEATLRVPHRAEPLLMSIDLAQKTSDPKRMADAIDRLLSLGWPGEDEFFRAEAGHQAQVLAKTLLGEGRGQEADALLASLPAAEARDLFVRLTWDGHADYDLSVEEPLGATACFQTPRTVFGGSIVKNGYGNHPEEVYVCPRGFDGEYKIRISMIWTNPARPVTRLTLEAFTHEGTAQENKQVFNLVPDKLGEPLVVHLAGGRRKVVLPYVDPAAVAREMLPRPGAGTAAKPAKGTGTAVKPSSPPQGMPQRTTGEPTGPRS